MDKTSSFPKTEGSSDGNESGSSPSPLAQQDVIDFTEKGDFLFMDTGVDGESGNAKKSENDFDGNDEVMRLAARLAPAFEDAHDLFQVPAEFQKPGQHDDSGDDNFRKSCSDGMIGQEDDDLKFEISDLARSEELLRQEMEQANFFSNVFTNSPTNDELEEAGISQAEPPPSVSEADIGTSDLDAPEQNLDLPPIDEAYHVVHQTPQRKQQHEQSSSPRPSGRKTMSPSKSSSTASPAPIVAMGRVPVSYDLSNHQEFMEITIENGWYMVDLNRFLLPTSLLEFSAYLPSISDFCISCPENRLKTWYIGFAETSTTDQKHNYILSPLPVRTSVVHIRPDVLCGAVMDAVVAATSTLADTEPDQLKDHSILRRQGGHLELALTTADDLQFLVDVQLCTHKTNRCGRVLLVRIFRCSDPADQREPSLTSNGLPASPQTGVHGAEDETTPDACLYLREACALVQRIEIEATNATSKPHQQIRFRPAQSPSISDRDAIAGAFGKHLRKTYKACPSTQEGNITLPALNSDDWELLKSSWGWSHAIWEELESRSLTYSSLATTRFGAFPCLPTLDVHYCSQIRRYSRETMILQLLKSATQLEEYARDAEHACANVIALLRKAFNEYGVEPPPLPVAIPLTSYPLEHASPQALCPPWGLKVMETLNQVQAWVDEAGKKQAFTYDATAEGADLEALVQDSTGLAAQSVAAVVQAFQEQDDEEKGARLQRKNMQVLERLSVMKKHQMASVELLDQCTADRAQRAADELYGKTSVREVPLLKCGVVAGSNTGTCIVTARHILFVTQLVPLLAVGQKVHMFSLQEVEFELEENAPVFLKALPTVLRLEKDGQEVFSFRPSVGGTRIKTFLDIVKSLACSSKSVLST